MTTFANSAVAAEGELGYVFDERLSLEARGALQFALLHPGPIGPDHLRRTGTISRHKVYSILRELIDAGYCQRVEEREGGSFVGVTYRFRPCADLPYTVSPYTDYPLYIYNIYNIYNTGDTPDTVEPYTVNRHTVTNQTPPPVPEPEPDPVDPPVPVLPAAPEAPPASDPLLGFAQPRWKHRSNAHTSVRQRATDDGLDHPTLRTLVDLLAELHGTAALINSGDEEELLRMQNMAVKIHQMAKGAGLSGRLEEFTKTCIQRWKDERGARLGAPFNGQFVQFVSQCIGDIQNRLNGNSPPTPPRTQIGKRSPIPPNMSATIQQLHNERKLARSMGIESNIPETDEEIFVWLQQQQPTY